MNYQKKNNYSVYKKTSKPPPKARFEKMFCILSIIFFLAPYPYYGLYRSMGTGTEFFAPLFAGGLICLGYFAQFAYSKIRKFERVRADGTYENMESFFAPKRAVGPFILAGVIALVCFFASRAYLVWRAEVGLDLYFDTNALLPFFMAIFGAVFICIGAVIWFYPVNFIVSIRFVIPVAVNFALLFGLIQYFFIMDLTFYLVCSGIGIVFAAVSFILIKYYESFMR